ncbi:MAG: class I SAM-dependent methyltransferase [Candidatus Methylumidiphilus sp.]
MQKPDDPATLSANKNDAVASIREGAVDSSNHHAFISYYEEQSQQANVIEGFERVQKVLSRFYFAHIDGNSDEAGLKVIDIGCGAGTQAIVWARKGYQVSAVDVSERLIDVAKERAAKVGVAVDFKVGSASRLPFAAESMDICLMPELLEHVPDWLTALEECSKVLKPGGMLFVSTSNALCPVQDEYALPMYSWYPGFIKRICEQKAITTHRHWVKYATYPAVNWFSNPGLSKTLSQMGFTCYDRFDMMDLSGKPAWAAFIVRDLLLRSQLLRHMSYFFTGATIVLAIKNAAP